MAEYDLTRLFNQLEELNCSAEMCGSRVTCNPPIMDTDVDYLIQILAPNRGDEPSQEQISNVVQTISSFGFMLDCNEHYQSSAVTGFMSFKLDGVNLLVSANAPWCTRHRAATTLCKRLNLMHKPDRIAVFQAVLYANIHLGT